DPDREIEALADHAANAAALRRPITMAGALLMRAWNVEAREHEFAIDQRVRDLLGHPQRRIVSSQELHDAELPARLIARGRWSGELYALARRTRHAGHQYSKLWAVDLDDLRRPALAYHEGDVLAQLARQAETEGAAAPN